MALDVETIGAAMNLLNGSAAAANAAAAAANAAADAANAAAAAVTAISVVNGKMCITYEEG